MEEQKKKREYKQRDLTAPLEVLTEAQMKVLLYLTNFRYLTVKQMQALGVAKTPTGIRNMVLYRLTKRTRGNLVQVQEYFATSLKGGRIPYVYALTSHGAEKVAELFGFEGVRYPVGKIQYVADFFHREAYIDFCIEVEKWQREKEEREILTFSHYFDKNGSNRKGTKSKSVNRVYINETVGEIEPDGLFLVNTGEKIRAGAVEIHNRTDTKRVIEQLAKHTHAIQSGAISQKLKYDKVNFVLSVAMTEEQKKMIQKRFLSVESFGAFGRAFVFSDLETLKNKGFALAFEHANGEPAPIFL